MPKKKDSNAAQEYQKAPYKSSVDEFKNELQADIDVGLTKARAEQLKTQYGENKLNGEGGVKWYTVLIKQISNAMILVLVLAMALSYGVTGKHSRQFTHL